MTRILVRSTRAELTDSSHPKRLRPFTGVDDGFDFNVHHQYDPWGAYPVSVTAPRASPIRLRRWPLVGPRSPYSCTHGSFGRDHDATVATAVTTRLRDAQCQNGTR